MNIVIVQIKRKEEKSIVAVTTFEGRLDVKEYPVEEAEVEYEARVGEYRDKGFKVFHQYDIGQYGHVIFGLAICYEYSADE